MKALIVDDDVFVRKFIREMIPWASLGFDQLLEADNGAVALDVAMREKPDLVISDVKMPVLNGLELSQRLRHTMVDTYIILLSEYSDFEYVQKAINCGVQDYVLKPFTKECIAQIIGKIRQIVANHEKKRYYNALMTDRAHMRALIRDMLDRSDVQACRELFDRIANDHIHIDDIKRFTLLFLDELFEQMIKTAFRKSELAELRRVSLARHDGLKRIADLLDFTETLCNECVALNDKHIKPAESYIRMILEYIDQHYADPDLSVAKIAEYLHLSPVYVGALFKQHQGTGMIAHIHEVRICVSMEMIKDLSLSISDISARIGYLTPDYFTKVFKKATGLAPSEYRNMILVRESGHL